MHDTGTGIVILIADDDVDDCELAREALNECRLANQLRFVHDGAQLMNYLRRRGDFATPGAAPRPGLLLLDLNMPKMDGREALREIKADPVLCDIPTVILTTSHAEEDVCRSYKLGANSYVTKPVSFEGLVHVMKSIGRYWFQIVELPPSEESDAHGRIARQSTAR
ncbi:MAG: response regulator [Candidatus Zixiibacteriota bacterium]